MKKYFLDTNFLYALFAKDALSDAAYAIFEDIADSELITSVIVVAELYSSNQNMHFFQALEDLNIKVIDLTLTDILAMTQILNKETRNSLKSNDSIILTQAQITDAKLITFDKKLSKYYKLISK